MRNRSVIATLCAAALGLAAAAPASTKEPQSNTVAEKQVPQKKICRWLPVTGSNINQKVCLTAEDWKKAEALSW